MPGYGAHAQMISNGASFASPMIENGLSVVTLDRKMSFPLGNRFKNACLALLLASPFAAQAAGTDSNELSVDAPRVQ